MKREEGIKESKDLNLKKKKKDLYESCVHFEL